MFILDTDSITHHQKAHPTLTERVNNTPHEHLFTTSVTIEEQMKGRLAFINRHRNVARTLSEGYASLVQAVSYFNRWNVVLYDEDVDRLFRQLRRLRVRIGTQDLRIAAIALQHAFTVVTSNQKDFGQVPNLKTEDWTRSVEAG